MEQEEKGGEGMMHKFRAHVERSDFGRFFEVILFEETEDGYLVLTNSGIREFKGKNTELYIEDKVRINMDSAQQLMDELWRCGIRPSEGTGSAGAMAATQEHIRDLRFSVQKLFDLIAAGRQT